MPYWFLSDKNVFPHPLAATPEGLLAVGGDLGVDRLKLAYAYGIFPWYGPDEPILWWFPDPRCVLRPESVHISTSMRKLVRRTSFEVTFDHAFERVINLCCTTQRKKQDGTWINDDIIEAYIKLYKVGVAHSVEVWDEEELIGGIYGVAIGKVFFGESMFSLRTNASKYALIALCKSMAKRGFRLLDCQQDTAHMRSMGGELVCAEEFHSCMTRNRLEDPGIGTWSSVPVPILLPG